jgi:FkbM family methyltransferase
MLDVGANDGDELLDFTSQFFNYRIFAFEPDPRAAARFALR